MTITLSKTDLEKAIISHINILGFNTNNKKVDIDFIIGRSEHNRITANVEVEDIDTDRQPMADNISVEDAAEEEPELSCNQDDIFG